MAEYRTNEIILELERLHTAIADHERDIARYTQIQMYTNIISVCISAFTTFALLFLTYSQSKISENQFLFETRKSSPKILAAVLKSSELDIDGSYEMDLDVVKIIFEKNEAEVNEIQIIRDFIITKEIEAGSNSRQYSCVFRTKNFAMPVQVKNSGQYSYYKAKFNLPFGTWTDENIPNAKYAFGTLHTIVKISYQDVLGITNTVVHSGVNNSIFRSKTDSYPSYKGTIHEKTGLIEIASSNSVPGTVVQRWNHPLIKYTNAGCQHLAANPTLVNFETPPIGI